MDPLIHLNYQVNKDLLLAEAEQAKSSASGYTDPRYPGEQHDGWLIGHHTSDYVKQIMADLGVDGRPRFYWLLPGEQIPEHVDNGTQCSINIVLTSDAAPVTIEGKDYFYSTGLLNTKIPHSVQNNDNLRIMLKISIFDETYEQVANRIKFKA
jgi:hypothetical protein